MERIQTGVFFGGKSSEYPVSLHSVASFLQNIDQNKYEPVLIGIDRDGKFYRTDATPEEIEADAWLEKAELITFGQGGFYDKDQVFHGLDVVFPVLHGKNGEDGSLQGLLQLYEIPFVGCSMTSSANCMDKERMHRLFDAMNIPAADYLAVYEKGTIPSFEEVRKTIPLPWIIKSCNSGSSFGVRKVEKEEEYLPALEEAFKWDGKGKALIEECIDGFEIGAAVMGNDDLVIGALDEIETSAPFFDYEGKYDMKDSTIYCPARLSPDAVLKGRKLAEDAYRALECSGFARVDMFVRKNGEILMNEINTIPGMTKHSRYPSMMKEAGIEFPALIDQLITLALENADAKPELG